MTGLSAHACTHAQKHYRLIFSQPCPKSVEGQNLVQGKFSALGITVESVSQIERVWSYECVIVKQKSVKKKKTSYRLMPASRPTAALYPWWCGRRCRCRRPRLRSKPEPLFQRCSAEWWWHVDEWNPGSMKQKHKPHFIWTAQLHYE